MAPKSNSANHWQLEDIKTSNESEDELQIVEPEVKLEIDNDSTDDDLEIVNVYNANVMDLTTDLNPLRRKSNIFNSTHVVQRTQLMSEGAMMSPAQLSRLKNEVEIELDSLNQSVEQVDIDQSKSDDDTEGLVIDESTPPRESGPPPISTNAFTPGKVKASEFKLDMTLDSSSSSLQDLTELKSEDEEMSTNVHTLDSESENECDTSNNLFNQSSSNKSSSIEQPTVQTPSTKFRRRSQLPLRPETHDDSNEKELEDFNGSIRRSPLVKKYYKYF